MSAVASGGGCPRSGYVKWVHRRITTALKRVAQGVVIVMLVIIPVPVGRLFARLFDQKPRATAALVVRREDELDDAPPRTPDGETR